MLDGHDRVRFMSDGLGFLLGSRFNSAGFLKVILSRIGMGLATVC